MLKINMQMVYALSYYKLHAIIISTDQMCELTEKERKNWIKKSKQKIKTIKMKFQNEAKTYKRMIRTG